jgi:hypothetical protein
MADLLSTSQSLASTEQGINMADTLIPCIARWTSYIAQSFSAWGGGITRAEKVCRVTLNITSVPSIILSHSKIDISPVQLHEAITFGITGWYTTSVQASLNASIFRKHLADL